MLVLTWKIATSLQQNIFFRKLINKLLRRNLSVLTNRADISPRPLKLFKYDLRFASAYGVGYFNNIYVPPPYPLEILTKATKPFSPGERPSPDSNSNSLSPEYTTYLSIYLSIYLSMVLQSFCWTLAAFFSFLILNAVGWTHWTGDEPVSRPLPTHKTTQTQNKSTQTSMP
jgi:hypothetical protein